MNVQLCNTGTLFLPLHLMQRLDEEDGDDNHGLPLGVVYSTR